jgi:hypothetical protein
LAISPFRSNNVKEWDDDCEIQRGVDLGDIFIEHLAPGIRPRLGHQSDLVYIGEMIEEARAST